MKAVGVIMIIVGVLGIVYTFRKPPSGSSAAVGPATTGIAQGLVHG